MSDVEMKIEVETEDFSEELSDEALDREGARARASGLLSACGFLPRR